MDGNSAKKVPILDHLVDTKDTKPDSKTATQQADPLAQNTEQTTAKPVLTSMNGAYTPNQGVKPQPVPPQAKNTKPDIAPQNRRTDKSEFEIELTKTVNEIMLKHFELASEEIVQQVLSEVRARLPGRKKN